MDTNNSNHQTMQSYYQKGYAEGYKRHKNNADAQREAEHEYMYNVLIVIFVFVIFIVGVICMYGKNAGINSRYEGDCLIDLATSYQSRDCLVN